MVYCRLTPTLMTPIVGKQRLERTQENPMAMKKTGFLCAKHGGNCNPADAEWLCDECAVIGYNPCQCEGRARGFGEALFSMVGCEDCDERVSGVGINARLLWNQGVRGDGERITEVQNDT